MYRLEPKIVLENESETTLNNNPYVCYLMMDDLLDKLQLLNYDWEFVSELQMKPLHRHYFTVGKNPGEQFYLFTCLAAWLVRKCGKQFDQPQEYDDPNSTIATILTHLRELGITVDFSASKLKQGVGEQVIYVLDHLADAALKSTNFKWQQLVKLIQEKEPDVQMIEDDSELMLDKVEEEMAAAYMSDDDDNDDDNNNDDAAAIAESDTDNLFNADNFNLDQKQSKPEDPIHIKNTLTKGNTDEASWKLELERILPQLKVTIKSESRDWRTHLEQMRTHRNGIDEVLAHTKNQLDKLHQHIAVTLETIENREKHLNRDLEPMLAQYRIAQDELSKLQDNYNSINGGVIERTGELTKFSEQLDSIKRQMEERGTSMTDGTPLVSIRKGMTRIKTEIAEMDVRIGVLENMLLQSRISEEKLLEDDLANPLSAR